MILVIDNYDSFTYNLYQCVAQYHADVRVIRNDKITIAEIKAMQPSRIILSPGPGRPEEAGICIELIIALNGSIPLLGVCLGHQAIVTAFGGKVIHAPLAVHGKHELIYHNGKGLYKNLPMPFQAGRYHSLVAEPESLPHVLQIDSESTQGLIMGVHHTTLPIYGVQFHPESILTPMGSQLLQNFIG